MSTVDAVKNVVKAEKELEKESVDLLIIDPWRSLHGEGKEILNLPKEKRDKYIKKVKMDLLSAYNYLRVKPTGGNMLIGVNLFSMSSFGEDLFGKEKVKRALVWSREPKAGTEKVDGYTDSSRWFLWGIKERNWTFNLLGDEKYFDSCFYSTDGDRESIVDVAKTMILRFTNEGDTVMVVNDYAGSVLKEAAEAVNRNYISALRNKNGVMVHA